MSSEASAACKSIVAKADKHSLETYEQPSMKDTSQSIPVETPQEVLLIDNCSTLIEVTVKTKGRKRSSTMVSSSPMDRKAIEEKRRPNSIGETQNWSRILREQNRPMVKQGLQRLASKSQFSESSKHGVDSKYTKKKSDVPKHRKQEFSRTSKDLDKIPVKQTAMRKTSENRLKAVPSTTVPSSTSLASSMDSILVVDRAVQCGGIFDCSDKFGVFNPVRTLGFLMKELEHFVKDEKSNKILSDMEQVLLRIPTELGKPSSLDLEAIALRTKLEASTVQLEETSKKLNEMCESLREERDSLQRQVRKQATLLEDANQRYVDLESSIKKLRHELEKAAKTIEIKEKIISQLKDDCKGVPVSQKVIADLKSNLDEQIEVARQKHLEIQYLMLEKDKLSVLSSYKDSLLIEFRIRLRELQNYITEQLLGLKEAYVESTNPQMSVVHGGMACSSPTSTSEHSNVPTSWRDMSDVSLSTIEQNQCTDEELKTPNAEKNKISSLSSDMCADTEKKPKSNSESKIKDNAHLDFISLPGGESSRTILLSSCKDHTSKESHLGKSNRKETIEKSPPKSQKYSTPNKNRNSKEKGLEHRNASKIIKDNLSNDQIGSNIKEQVQTMFEDIRLQSKIPVNVPSPPRRYPHPDWSDSSLPSISAVSELNAVQSNET